MKELMTVSEVAKVIRTNRNSVYKLIHAGELKAMNINGLKIAPEHLQEFMTSRTLQNGTARKEEQ